MTSHSQPVVTHAYRLRFAQALRLSTGREFAGVATEEANAPARPVSGLVVGLVLAAVLATGVGLALLAHVQLASFLPRAAADSMGQLWDGTAP